jgi:acetone carboxylase, beta subunit
MAERNARVLAIDAGGTMTDTFIVDEAGSFVVGKAQTTPEDESAGFMASAEDALDQWRMKPEDAFGGIASGIFSGTAMLNRLLSRTGRNIGAIVTAGQEDYLVIERGIQTYLGFSYSDRLHLATHHHNPPIVPRSQMKGVRGRIDVLGQEVLPLREADVRDAAAELLDAGVEGICVCLLFSYRNAAHELRAAELVEEVKAERGRADGVPVYVSSQLYPMRRDLPRLNSTLIEAYAAEPSRGTLKAVRDRTKDRGAGFELRVMASHGGTVSIEARELATTLVSGPIGGVVGGQALAERMELRNVLCTDIGGTSFDIALITDGRFEITPTPDIARFVLNMPLVKIDSIGAGTGSFVRINPNSNRPELGPDSAGSRIGVSWPEGGLETVSVTDLNVVLGRVNPDFFLGGNVQLDPERARAEVKRQVADPLGLDVTDAAADRATTPSRRSCSGTCASLSTARPTTASARTLRVHPPKRTTTLRSRRSWRAPATTCSWALEPTRSFGPRPGPTSCVHAAATTRCTSRWTAYPTCSTAGRAPTRSWGRRTRPTRTRTASRETASPT